METNQLSDVWLILTFFLILIITWSVFPYITFSGIGIPGPTPLPFVGNFLPLIIKGFTASENEWRQKYGEIYRFYEGRKPVVMVWNLDMLKNILIKDFSTFPNRRDVPLLPPEIKDSLLSLKDERWKEVRTTLTPAFTSGKLKNMMSLVTSCCEDLVESFGKVAESRAMLEASEYFGAFTLDVIASTAFGVQVKSQKDKTDPFVVTAKNSFRRSLSIPFFLMTLFPFLAPLFKPFFNVGIPKSSINFFKTNTQNILNMRRSGKQERNDFIQLMINSHLDVDATKEENIDFGSSKPKGLTDSEVIAQSIVFFLAGYETTATTLSNAVYLLSLHPEWQDKIVQQILNTVGHEKEITYDDLSNLSNIEMVVMETLRLYPPALRIQRTSTKNYQLGPYKIPKGTIIAIPIYNIHHDENVWPNPERFDPERFSPETKSDPAHHPMRFLAFGNGPRICIGLRLAMLEAKLALAYLLRRFKVRPCEKTEIPLIMTNTQLSRAKNGIWIQVEKRH